MLLLLLRLDCGPANSLAHGGNLSMPNGSCCICGVSVPGDETRIYEDHRCKLTAGTPDRLPARLRSDRVAGVVQVTACLACYSRDTHLLEPREWWSTLERKLGPSQSQFNRVQSFSRREMRWAQQHQYEVQRAEHTKGQLSDHQALSRYACPRGGQRKIRAVHVAPHEAGHERRGIRGTCGVLCTCHCRCLSLSFPSLSPVYAVPTLVQRGSALFIGVFAFILNPDPAQRLQGQKRSKPVWACPVLCSVQFHSLCGETGFNC